MPLASADHTGPCTHEPVDAALTGSPKVVLNMAVYCAFAPVCWVLQCPLTLA